MALVGVAVLPIHAGRAVIQRQVCSFVQGEAHLWELIDRSHHGDLRDGHACDVERELVHEAELLVVHCRDDEEGDVDLCGLYLQPAGRRGGMVVGWW